MAGAKGTGRMWEERGLRSGGVGPGGHCEGRLLLWEVTLEGAEQKMDEVDLKRVNSRSGYCMESRL